MTAVEAERLALLRGGYSPIPCEGKRPVLKAWEKRVATNADEIKLWSKVYERAENTGALTATMPTIDIDIKNPEAAAAIEDLARERFEERGFFLVRIGEAPKRAILLRTDQPFAKITANLTAPDGATEKIELLCDGQQVVCFGIHPGTGKPYAWHGGEPGDIAREDLPYVRHEDAIAFVEAACAVLVTDFGYVRADGERPRQRKSTAGEDTAQHGPVDRDKIKAALKVIDSGSYDTWLHVGAALHHELGESGFEIFDAWSVRSPKYQPDESKRKWRDVRDLTEFTAGTIFHLADQADPGWRDRYDSVGHQQTNDKPLELVPINLAQYDTEKIPASEWGVENRFPRRTVGLLSGHGGIGKSLLLLQLSAAHVLQKDWLRSLPEKGPVLLVNCEDDEGELVRRLQPILKHYGASYGDVAADLHVFSLVERDDATGQLLATAGRAGIVRPTPLYDALMEQAHKVKPICIVIDNVADVFGGNEISRSEVRQFCTLMRRLARAANGYVIMSAHPSVAGMQNKSGLSGSTQWHNSVRARAYLRNPNEKKNGNDDDADDTAVASDRRVLQFMKSNYSRLAEQIELQWKGGLYLPTTTPSAPEAAAARNAADRLFLELLDKHTREGANVSGSPAARNFAPRIFAKTKEAKLARTDQRAFADALSRLVEASQVCVEPYGKPSDGTKRLVRRLPESATPGDTPRDTAVSTPPAPGAPHPPAPHPFPIRKGGVAPGVRDVAKPFRVIGPAPPGTVCVGCHLGDDGVKKIRSAMPGSKAESLHPECATRWFSGGLA